MIIVGIMGGSGSGKTTMAQKLVSLLNDISVVQLPQDAYYKDQSHLPMLMRESVNYDCPEAIDVDLLIYHLKNLKRGMAIEKPAYDFTTHTREKDNKIVNSGEIIILEGTLIFVYADLLPLMDVRVFLDIPADIRLARRILRDTRYRGRSVEIVIKQWLDSVRIMDEQYLSQTKCYADILFTEDPRETEMEMLAAKIRGQYEESIECIY